MTQDYYYRQMSRDEQEAYRNMLSGFQDVSPEFPVRRLENRELSDVFFRLRLDHPEIFFAEGFHYRFTQDSQYVRMCPEYMFEKKKIREHQKALEGRVNRLVRQAGNMTLEEKERFVHDFICENVTYDKLKKAVLPRDYRASSAGRRRVRGDCKNRKAPLRLPGNRMCDRCQRGRPGQGNQVPPRVECAENGRELVSSGCHL